MADHDPHELFKAAQYGEADRVQILIQEGYDVNATFEGHSTSTALQVASYSGQVGIVETLLRNGAHVDARNSDETTSLHWAALNGHTEVVELLLTAGAPVDARDRHGNTPLHDATTTDRTEIIKVLLNANADIDAKNRDGRSSLHVAAVRNNIDSVRVLLFAEADAEIKDSRGKTPKELVHGRGQQARRLRSLFSQYKRNKEYDVLMKTCVPQDVCKLFMCGYGRVGKTTLHRSLQKVDADSEHTEYEPTPGVDVTPVDIPNAGKFSMWDFAGQPEFYVTHNMFLGAQEAIFMVVYKIVDVEGDRPIDVLIRKRKEINCWLRFIKATNVVTNLDKTNGQGSSRKPTVILVGSQEDLVQPRYMKMAQLAHSQLLMEAKKLFGVYLNILEEEFLLDCRVSEGPDIERLRGCLRQAKSQKQIPNLCAEILKKKDEWIEDTLFPVITLDKFMNHIKKLDPLLDEDFIRLSTNYLQDMGEILIIKSEKSTISDTIILRPQWLCANVFGPMLATEIFVQYSNRLQRKKVHSKQDLTDVFQQYANTDMLLHLLEKFELLFEVEPPIGGVVQDNGQRMFYIIPSLLDYQMPDEQWQREGSKQIYYGRRFQCRDETDSFSPGLFPRLQTRLHRYFTEIGCPPSGIWKNGIKVCDEVEGLVYMTKDWKAIHICVRAEREDEIGECYEMLEKISEDTHGLLEVSCPGSNIDCHILSAHSMKNHHRQEYVKYYATEKILEAEKGKKRVFDEELGTAENVFDLLCCGYDTTMLHRQGYLSDVRWMLHDTRVEFTTAMDVHQETGNDYRLMADLMGIRYKEVKAWESRATSVTERILTEWSTRWMNRTKKRRPPSRANIFYESSFLNLIAVLREPSMQREDAAHLLREMFSKLGVVADERAQVEDGESVILEDDEEQEDSDASE